MRIAIATENGEVSQHFGHCPQYTLVDISEGRVVHQDTISNPGHRPDFLPGYLAQKGVNCIVAGGMGPRAQELFAQENIQTILGVTGTVGEVISSYLANRLSPGESSCDHPGGYGHCQHE